MPPGADNIAPLATVTGPNEDNPLSLPVSDATLAVDAKSKLEPPARPMLPVLEVMFPAMDNTSSSEAADDETAVRLIFHLRSATRRS